jgi:hypothetical protein
LDKLPKNVKFARKPDALLANEINGEGDNLEAVGVSLLLLHAVSRNKKEEKKNRMKMVLRFFKRFDLGFILFD